MPHSMLDRDAAGGRKSRRRVRLRGAALGVALLCAASAARADWVPERRRDYEQRRPNEYLIVPAVASLPGIGVFGGLLVSASNPGGTGLDVAATVAESLDNTDIHVQAVALREVPLYRPYLRLEYQRAHIKLGNLQSYLPGRDSPNYTIPVTAQFDFQMVRPVLRFWERRITFTYTLGYFEGFSFDNNGNEVPEASHGASANAVLDLTDDVINPTVGIRLFYNTRLPAPEESFFGRTRHQPGLITNNDVTIEQYNAAGYVPLGGRFNLALNSQFFQAFGQESSGRVISGGSPPLRGYPGGRWKDRFGVFAASELRYTVPLNYDLDAYLARGIVEGLQWAVFYELGQVAPHNDSSLFRQMHESYGAGVRALFQAVVVRFDLAMSDEGRQTHLTIDQHF
jgi:outer membrane protein assembly factor BamA